MPLVEVLALKKQFGSVLAVNEISFSVKRGEVLGFLGPNGAGKSTTMKMIAGILEPSSGTAIVAGNDVRRNPVEAKRHLGYLPEGSPLYADMTLDGFLDFIGRARLMPEDRRKSAIANVIDLLGLSGMRHRRLETLSKGYRRRVGVAQAILHDPEVLVLDEPTDGLDPNQKHEVRNLIRAMGSNKAIIISTHIMEEVDAVCDRAIIIDRGRLLLDEAPADLYKRSPDYNAVSVVLAKAEAERAVAALKAVPVISAVEHAKESEGMVSLIVRPSGRAHIDDTVSRLLAEINVGKVDVSRVNIRLDDVFRSVTAAEKTSD